MWEDDSNVKGGRWLVVVDKQIKSAVGTSCLFGSVSLSGSLVEHLHAHRRAQLLDHYWLELLMAIIGEQFEDLGEYICGAVVNVRQKGDKGSCNSSSSIKLITLTKLAILSCRFKLYTFFTQVSLWTRDATRDDVNTRIGLVLKAKLDIPDSEPLRYEVHKDSSVRTSSMVKPRIMIPNKEAAATAAR
ncbi:unnamed protein product [Strongylus vulgaris]|uniref:Uncharacterized protein n=1 Tax=Strongylus vulgaris TaxID=40348 RepID=A0A3P7JQK1_STRVU|nr:unnamed protein product [Strongylus vulgaris]